MLGKSELSATCAFLRQNGMLAEHAIVLGTGLGGLISEINVIFSIEYDDALQPTVYFVLFGVSLSKKIKLWYILTLDFNF